VKPLHNESAAADLADRGMQLLFELSARLGDLMHRGLAERGLSMARAEVLWQLQRGGPATQRQLSQALRCTPRNVTGLLDALQTSGYVARGPHPTDRRATLVTLTDQGRSVAGDWDRDYQSGAADLFAGVPPRNLAAFVGVLDQVVTRLGEGTTLPSQ
jgi:DNA-binding MarR family transcriptional regulator